MSARITIEINNNENTNILKIIEYGTENQRNVLDGYMSVGTWNHGRALSACILCRQGWRIDGVEFGWFGMDGGVVWGI